MKLTGKQKEVFIRRYVRKDEKGNPLETIDDVFRRVAGTVAGAERNWHRDDVAEEWEEKFYKALSSLEFLPNSPTFTGAGTPLGLLSSCWVLPVEDDMGRERGGIFDTLKDMALLFQTGGGVGISLSKLRPAGAFISTSGGKATGPVGFLKVYDKASEVISQGGVRRGAGMAVLKYNHPDILEFINCKDTENDITNFNLSVAVNSDFMEKVANDGHVDLINPQNGGGLWDQIPARRIMDEITKHALKNGEPGLIFLDRANDDDPCPHLGSYEACNPCGEEFLKPYQNCCLGTINLVAHLNEDGLLVGDKLRETIRLGVRFLDDVIDANKYLDSIPELGEKAKETRRIGLGITGLADVLYINDVRYGSEKAVSYVEDLMKYIKEEAMRASAELAKQRGPFPEYEKSIYNIDEWEKWEHGLRNATFLTVAPTGTRSTIAGVEGYGCEPVFALAYTRTLVEREGDIELGYTSDLFEQALKDAGLDSEERANILSEVAKTGSCQDVKNVPNDIKEVYVTARDIPPDEHIEMQAALQRHVDAGISKTINMPNDTTAEDIEKAFMKAWSYDCKGITVYVSGSREKVVLETEEEKKAKKEIEELKNPQVYDRPTELRGITTRQPTPLGTAFVTTNYHGEEPFEVFINIGRAGSDIAAVAEGLGRLISLILRIPSRMAPTTRLKYVVEQLKGIGGGNPLGFGKNRIRSLPDGVAEVLGKQLGLIAKDNGKEDNTEQKIEQEVEMLDLCPECGNATLVTEEGCSHCKTCGYKKC